jgi:hypothetical protein
VSIIKEQKTISAVLDDYREQLDLIPDDEFDATPPAGGWSCAEVYSHIMQASIASTIPIERCTHSTSKPTNKKLNFWGWYVMLMNRFPPIKAKVPPKVEARMPATKISKEEARNLIIKLRKRVDEIAILINTTPSVRRSQHPRLGMLSSAQWLKFIRIHLQHHLRQVNRIKKQLKIA